MIYSIQRLQGVGVNQAIAVARLRPAMRDFGVVMEESPDTLPNSYSEKK